MSNEVENEPMITEEMLDAGLALFYADYSPDHIWPTSDRRLVRDIFLLMRTPTRWTKPTRRDHPATPCGLDTTTHCDILTPQ
jgi:hypothetical protein